MYVTNIIIDNVSSRRKVFCRHKTVHASRAFLCFQFSDMCKWCLDEINDDKTHFQRSLKQIQSYGKWLQPVATDLRLLDDVNPELTCQ